MVTGRVVQLALLSAVTFCALTLPVLGIEKPDISQIAEALRQQESGAGPSLQITYTAGNPDDPCDECGNPTEVRYTRTPTMLFKELLRGNKAITAGEWNSRVSYNRENGIFRRIDKSYDGEFHGEIHNDNYWHGFNDAPSPDPIVLTLHPDATLLDLIGEGLVADRPEAVDGHLCWRVDIPMRSTIPDDDTHWSVWVDPDLGFCPRRMVSYSSKFSGVTVLYGNYKRIGNDIYFPMSVIHKYRSVNARPEGGWQSKVKKAVCGKTVAADEIAVVFPKGVKVRIMPGARIYTQP